MAKKQNKTETVNQDPVEQAINDATKHVHEVGYVRALAELIVQVEYLAASGEQLDAPPPVPDNT